jgi:GNAT superfamily N-acetyltransferase
MHTSITEGTLEEALSVLGRLPEFDILKPKDYYQQTLSSTSAHILIARDNNKPVGCKLGYDRFNDGSFYSWLGGVLPEYRKTGIAKRLAESQEHWARERGYLTIRFKTQNRHKAMLQFALKNGFSIYNVKPKDELDLYRIELIKRL